MSARTRERGMPVCTGKVVHAVLWSLLIWLCSAQAWAVDAESDLTRQIQAERQQRLERVIAQSSAQIESGSVEGGDLAEAFRNRGVARSHLVQYAEALEDFTRAIDIDQLNAQYYEDRAIIYLKLREYEAAAYDLDMALGLEPSRSSAFREKGRLAFYRKDFHTAAQEFTRALQTAQGETVVYSAMWLELALQRGGSDGQGPIGQVAAQLSPDQWPAPVVQMLAGTLAPEAAIAAATSVNPRQTLMQQCEAYFYAGQQYLIRQEPDKARAAFESAVATGVAEFLEYDWAVQELEQFKQL
ncbi:MAG: hypothetical protein KIS79_07525 [Burkholderiales bacterium]|nr:hypothetical protein [Burkholderiales bacterium]